MTKVSERHRALKMRSEGASIKEIADTLSVSKSTVSTWCKDISLTADQISAIAKRSQHVATAALLKSAERQRQKRLQNIHEANAAAQENIGKLTKRDIQMIGLGLYWGEGYKQGSQEFGFTNSDPHMITFYIHWLQKTFGVNKKDLILRISINEIHKKRIGHITEYWAGITDTSKEQFTKPSFIRTASKKVYPNPEKHFGTLRIKVRKGTMLRREVLAMIDYIANIKSR